MKSVRNVVPGVAAALLLLIFFGCDYEVPISQTPTGKVDARLLGNWVSADGKEKMKVRKWDDSTYAIVYECELSRAFHTDVAKIALVSIQNLEAPDGKWTYMNWKLSEDGALLTLRMVNDEVVTKEPKDSASMRKLIEKNLQNPNFLNKAVEFKRDKV